MVMNNSFSMYTNSTWHSRRYHPSRGVLAFWRRLKDSIRVNFFENREYFRIRFRFRFRVRFRVRSRVRFRARFCVRFNIRVRFSCSLPRPSPVQFLCSSLGPCPCSTPWSSPLPFLFGSTSATVSVPASESLFVFRPVAQQLVTASFPDSLTLWIAICNHGGVFVCK